MNKALEEYLAKLAREHEAWFEENAKDKANVRFFPYGTGWAEAADEMTIEEREFYKVHIEKSRWIDGLITDILAKRLM
jgi:hypothetical protein